MILAFFITWGYNALGSELSNIEQEYQWILILTVPLLRELTLWSSIKVWSKAAEGISPNELTIRHYFETRYAVFISIMLGGTATPESSYCLIAVDFLTNLYHGLKIIKKSKAGKDGKCNQVKHHPCYTALKN